MDEFPAAAVAGRAEGGIPTRFIRDHPAPWNEDIGV
jgi:hypothetical protein